MDLSNLKIKDSSTTGFDFISKISISLFVSLLLMLMFASILKGATLMQNIGEIKSGSLVLKGDKGKSISATTLDTKVYMNITGSINRVTLIQKFENPSDYWTEGIYLFPLPTDAAVDHMSMKVGDRIIVGQIKEKKEAKKIYQKAKKEGKVSSLIQQSRPNMFTTNVANIAPHSVIEVSIEYQQSILHKDDHLSVVFPMVVAPRYIHNKQNSSSVVISSNKNIQKIEDGLTNPISIDINMDLGYEASNIDALYHDISIVDKQNQKYHISFNSKEYANKDFVLNWKVKHGTTPKAAFYTQKKDGDIYGLLMLNPAIKSNIQKSNKPRELIFIIDSSGSMYGESMMQAKHAIKLALQTLKSTDRFNIVDFDNDMNPLFKSAVDASYSNISKARRFINNLKAQGGTEAYPALKYALNSIDKNSDHYLRQVIFITDGDIGNESKMFNLIKNDLAKNRLFTVGIGSAPNRYFMKKASEYGRGSFVYIGKIEEVKSKMSRLYQKISSPALTDIKVNFPSYLDVKLAPQLIPDLYDGDQIVVAMKMDSLPKSDISITGMINDTKWQANLSISHMDDTSGINVLWARKKIDEYMNQYENTYDNKTKDAIKKVIIDLALRHHIMTNFTSLVAVDKTPARIKEKLIKQNIKRNLPSGWDTKEVNAPRTATNSRLFLILALVLFSLAIFTNSFLRRLEDANSKI